MLAIECIGEMEFGIGNWELDSGYWSKRSGDPDFSGMLVARGWSGSTLSLIINFKYLEIDHSLLAVDY